MMRKKTRASFFLLVIAVMLFAVMLAACEDNSSEDVIQSQSTQILTVEQAMNIVYENYVDAELFYPGELDKWDGDTLFYCFSYDDGDDRYRYAYVNAMTGEVEIVDEIEGYTD